MAAEVAGKLSILTANGILGSAPGFLSGYTSIDFPRFNMITMQRRFEMWVFLPLDRLPFWTLERHLPKAARYEAPVELDLDIRDYLRCMP